MPGRPAPTSPSAQVPPAGGRPAAAGPGPGRCSTPALAGLSEARQQLFLFALTLVDRFRGDGLDAASDADVARRRPPRWPPRYETASTGLIYEQRPDSAARPSGWPTASGACSSSSAAGRPSGFAADAAAVLRQVEDRRQGGRSGPRLRDPRAFLELAGRMARRLGTRASSGPPAEARAGGRPAERQLRRSIIP